MQSSIPKPQGSFISYFSDLVKKHGGINLAQGLPGFQPPAELLRSLSEAVEQNVHQYAPGNGNFQLLELIHKYYSKEYKVDKENFLVLQGATEAISLTYTYLAGKLKGNFSALSFDPAYESYTNLPKIFGQKYVSFPLDRYYSYNPDKLKEAIIENNVRVIFISSPGNPYGKIWNKDEVDMLVELSHELDFYIIFDAVYKELFFENPPYIPLQRYSPNLFYVNSFSKMLCITGWRIGYLYMHKEHRNSIRSIHDYTGLCTSSVLQVALSNYLSRSNFGSDFVKQFRQDARQGFLLLKESLTKLGFEIPQTDGGCFIWAKLPSDFTDGFEFAHNLYHSEGVAVIPGEHFSSERKDWLRFNIARPISEIEQGVEKITQFISKSM